MRSFLVVYGTGEGQTAQIATRLAEGIEDRGHDVTTVDVEEFPDALADELSEEVSLATFDAILVGSSVHIGKHHSGIREFIETNRGRLERRPTGFFQVSLSSAEDDPERRAEAASYVDSLLESAEWNPDRIGLFGGALRYSKYGFLKRLVMKRIARKTIGDTDTSQDYEYTDWEEVDAFANDFAAFVEGRLGSDTESPTAGDSEGARATEDTEK